MQKNVKLVLFSLFMLVIIDSMSFGIVLPVSTPLLLTDGSGILPPDTSMAVRNFYYSAMLTIGSIAIIISAPLIGYISDYMGRRKILLLSLIGVFLGYVLWAVSIHVKNVYFLLLGQAIDGLSLGGLALVDSAIMDVSPNEKKTSNLSFILTAGIIGGILGPLCSGFLANPSLFPMTGYATPFWIAAILSLLNAILLYYTFEETYAPPEKKTFHFRETLSSYTSGFTDKKVRLLSSILFVSEFAAALYIEFILMYLVEVFQYEPKQLGIFIAFVGVLSLITLNFLIPLALRVAREIAIIVFSFVVVGIFIFLAGFQPTQLAQWLYAIPIFIGFSLSEPALTTVISNSVSKKKQGWIMGVFESVGALAWLLAGMTVGLFGTISLFLPFAIAGILTILSAFGVILYKKKTV